MLASPTDETRFAAKIWDLRQPVIFNYLFLISGFVKEKDFALLIFGYCLNHHMQEYVDSHDPASEKVLSKVQGAAHRVSEFARNANSFVSGFGEEGFGRSL